MLDRPRPFTTSFGRPANVDGHSAREKPGQGLRFWMLLLGKEYSNYSRIIWQVLWVEMLMCPDQPLCILALTLQEQVRSEIDRLELAGSCFRKLRPAASVPRWAFVQSSCVLLLGLPRVDASNFKLMVLFCSQWPAHFRSPKPKTLQRELWTTCPHRQLPIMTRKSWKC